MVSAGWSLRTGRSGSSSAIVVRISGVRDITHIEIDVGLTLLLQLFQEKGLTEGFQFLGQLTEAERTLASDSTQRNRGAAETLKASLATA